MADHDLISAAAATLAELRGALPEGFRGPWALSGDEDYVVPVADVDEDPRRFYVVAHAALCAPFIARTSSPDVVEAVEGLLREIAKHDNAKDHHPWETCLSAINYAAARLAAAIERRPADPQEASHG